VAESAHVSDKVIKSLDEKSISLFDSLISSFFESRHIWPNEYIRRLSMVMHADAQHGNIIIIGRGGSFILKDKAFRVRIIAPFDTRVEKVVRDRKLPLKEAQGYVKKYDSDQIGFIRKYFNEDINDPKHYDIMVNMQNVGIETAAESIKKAFLAWRAVNENHQG